MLGAVIIGLAYPAILSPDAFEAVGSAVAKIGDRGPLENLVSAMPAGFLIGLLAWSLPSVGQQRILAVFIVTYLVGAGGFPHIIAGTVETTVLLINGTFNASDAASFILPVAIGNTLGGAALFAGLAYGQVREEVER
jgi:formate/nitrite transporter FocA (FNT family)